MVKVFDNGGATFDRYTIVTKEAVYGMSDNPSSPSGFNQFVEEVDSTFVYTPLNSEKELPLEMVPVRVLVAIINRLND
jgi:hypothetical protein